MKTLTVALLVGIMALVPVLAAASGGSTSSPKPGSSTTPAEKPSTSAPAGKTTDSPAASPSGGDMSKFRTKADCEKAGGMWTEASKTCKAKK